MRLGPAWLSAFLFKPKEMANDLVRVLQTSPAQLCETAVLAEELQWVLAETSHSSSQAHCHLSWDRNAGATSGSGFIWEKDTQACQTAAQTWP